MHSFAPYPTVGAHSNTKSTVRGRDPGKGMDRRQKENKKEREEYTWGLSP